MSDTHHTTAKLLSRSWNGDTSTTTHINDAGCQSSSVVKNYDFNEHILSPARSREHLPNARHNTPVNFGSYDDISIFGEMDGFQRKKVVPGRLEMIIGPMFASKTTELIRLYNRYKVLGKSILAVNHQNDVARYGSGNIASHDHDTIHNCLSCSKLCEIRKVSDYDDLDVIVIDELQFFEDAFEFCKKAVDEDGKILLVAGLDGDYLRRPFGQVWKLIPYADTVVKLTALCKKCGDGTPAPFTKRIVKSDNFILVGGCETYEAVCRYHFLNN